MEKVKLTFEKSRTNDKVTIRKDGGFSIDDMSRLTEAVEDLFSEPELEDSEVQEEKELEAGGEEPFITRVNREAKKAAAKLQGATKNPEPTKKVAPPPKRGVAAPEVNRGTGHRR